jgi:hypothetical protein
MWGEAEHVVSPNVNEFLKVGKIGSLTIGVTNNDEV